MEPNTDPCGTLITTAHSEQLPINNTRCCFPFSQFLIQCEMYKKNRSKEYRFIDFYKKVSKSN